MAPRDRMQRCGLQLLGQNIPALTQRWIHLLDRREIECVQHRLLSHVVARGKSSVCIVHHRYSAGLAVIVRFVFEPNFGAREEAATYIL